MPNRLFSALTAVVLVSCSGSEASNNGSGTGGTANSGVGGASALGSGGSSTITGSGATGGQAVASGGALASGGQLVATGGVVATGGQPLASGGSLATGGQTLLSTGGQPPATGGSLATGGSATGGAEATGGSATGGSVATGGQPPTTGGAEATGGSATGGAEATGGSATGGSVATGGQPPATGGTSTGGTMATGGDTSTGGSTTDPCSVTTPLSGGTAHCGANDSGVIGDNYWSLWAYSWDGSGEGCITPYGVDSAFNASWNENGGFLAGMGLVWNQSQTYQELGNLFVDYAYTRTGTGGGYSYIGIYGWSVSPLVEFYVVDDYFANSAPNITWDDGTQQGEFEVDGGTYRVFTHTQQNQPSIQGTATFQQYYSVRQEARQCGRISITEHFNEWASLGMDLGLMAEAKMLVEVGGGVGSIDYTLAKFTVD